MANFNEQDREFILALVRDAHTHGIMSIEYNGLKLTLRPVPANRAAPQAYTATWATSLPNKDSE